MAQKKFEGIVVNGQQLAQVIAFGEGDRCLDLTTGDIVRAKDCPETDIGEERPALKSGKRFIRIPAFDEMRAELKARYDQCESLDHTDNDELPLNSPVLEEFRERIEPIIEAARQDSDAARQDSDYDYENLHEDLGAEETALRWIANLRPIVMVGWSEDGFGVTRVYDPTEQKWMDAM
jgi:hypothetical protein